MWVYGVVFILLAISALMQEKNRKYANILIILFSIVYVCRARIGTDYIAYYNYFNMMHDFSDIGTGGFEVGYSFLSLILKMIGLPFQCMSMLISVFVIVALCRTIKKFDLEIGLVFFLLLYYFFYPTLEILRQQIAVTLFFYSLIYIRDMDNGMNNRHNIYMYFILNFIGVLFHRTAMISFVYFFFKRSRFLKIGITIFFVMFNTMQDFILNILSRFPLAYNRYNHYLFIKMNKGTNIDGASISFKLIEYVIVLLIIIFCKNEMGSFTKKHTFRINISPNYMKYTYKSEDKCHNDLDVLSVNQISKNIKEIVNISYNLLLMGILLQICVSPILGATYRIVYYCDLGLVLAFSVICKGIKNADFKLLYLLFVIAFIAIHLIRIFPFDNELFIYHFLI